MGLPVSHFLDDKAESADAFLFFKVVVGLGVGGRKEEGIVRRAGGRRAVGGEAWEKR